MDLFFGEQTYQIKDNVLVEDVSKDVQDFANKLYSLGIQDDGERLSNLINGISDEKARVDVQNAKLDDMNAQIKHLLQTIEQSKAIDGILLNFQQVLGVMSKEVSEIKTLVTNVQPAPQPSVLPEVVKPAPVAPKQPDVPQNPSVTLLPSTENSLFNSLTNKTE